MNDNSAFISQFSTKIENAPTIFKKGEYSHEKQRWTGMDINEMPDTNTKTHQVISSDDEGDYN